MKIFQITNELLDKIDNGIELNDTKPNMDDSIAFSDSNIALDLQDSKSNEEEGKLVKCNTCQLNASKSHFKSDFHRYNIKKKLHNQNIVSSLEFEEMEEISSIDGSSSDDEEEIDQRHKGSPFVHFELKNERNDLILYKQLLVKKHENQSWLDLLKSVLNIKDFKITILLLSRFG